MDNILYDHAHFIHTKSDTMKTTQEYKIGDCLDLLPSIEDESVDMVLTDLPYGTTQCKWDTIIPFEPLWEQYKRIIKPNGAIVLTAKQPFTSALVMSNIDMFKYDWTWVKEKGTGHLNAKIMPMQNKEDILIFGKKKLKYNPQFTPGKPYDGTKKVGNKQQTVSYNKYDPIRNDNTGHRYPKQTLSFNSVGRGGLHPTQKTIL